MTKTIAALFENSSAADYALDGLEQAGFTPYQISMLVNERGYKTAAGQLMVNDQRGGTPTTFAAMEVSGEDLIKPVVGSSMPGEDLRLCANGLKCGNVFLAVQAYTPSQEITAWNLLNDAHASRVMTFNA